jgi:hypothetical protein
MRALSFVGRAAQVAIAFVAVAYGGERRSWATDASSSVAETGSPERDETTTTFAPAAGVEVGLGTVYPTMGAPLGSILGRAGVAIHTPSPFAFVLGGEFGGAAALGSTASTSYGYIVRVPLKVFADGIVSRNLDYRTRRYLNVHFGGTVGPEFGLGAQCDNGNCNYIPPGVYVGFGARAGLSMSQGSRSSLGLFVRWDVDIAQCSKSDIGNCGEVLHTFTWSLGWSLF